MFSLDALRILSMVPGVWLWFIPVKYSSCFLACSFPSDLQVAPPLPSHPACPAVCLVFSSLVQTPRLSSLVVLLCPGKFKICCLLVFLVLFCFLEAGSHYVALGGPELTMVDQTSLQFTDSPASDSWILGLKCVDHNAWQVHWIVTLTFYGLDGCPPKAHLLKMWFPDVVLLRGGRNWRDAL